MSESDIRKASNPAALASTEWRSIVEALLPIGERVVAQMPDAHDPLLRQEMYRLILSGASMAYLGLFFGDAEHPAFWPVLNMAYNWGNPNPDDAYYMTAVDPKGVYRIHGSRGTVRAIDVQIGDGEFYTRGGAMGLALANYDVDDLKIDAQGNFEVLLSAERPAIHKGDWWKLDERATYIMVRQIAYDWITEVDGRLAIDRLDVAPIRPRFSAEKIESELRQIATWAENWPTVLLRMSNRVRGRDLVNKVELADFASDGGFTEVAQMYVQGVFQLEPDEALIYETELPANSHYWDVTVNDPNWSSIDFINRQAHINGYTAHIDSDGKFRAVFCATDPGVPNWLDTAGYRSGLILGRWKRCSSYPLPQTRLVKLAELRQHLPDDTPRMTPPMREAAIRARRIGAQFRRKW